MTSARALEEDRRVRVAVDAMGSDHGPGEVVEGALLYARDHGTQDVILVGDAELTRSIAGPNVTSNVSFVHASQVIGMDESPALALREKKSASILVAMDLVKRGEADAVVTAGHTGAGMAAAVLRLGRLPGVDRPALAVQMVTDTGPFVFLDIGANPDSTGENLFQYAHMGALFADKVLGVPEPRIALLSIGEEKGKGDARIQRATELLDASSLRFVGNVEGKDLVHHMADVAVVRRRDRERHDQVLRGPLRFIFDLIRTEFRRPPRGPLAYALMKPGLDRIRAIFDYEKVGGSPLLGVRGTVIITHGRARRRMISYAVGVAAAAAEARIPELIAETFRDTEPEVAS
jgi:glycerol-3-phosphate acyltransferase PlsX